jgi:hypothetical protein
MFNTSVESSEISTAKQLSLIGKCGRSPRYAPSECFLILPDLGLVN